MAMGWTDGDLAAVAPFDAVVVDVGALLPPTPPDFVQEPGPVSLP